MAEVVTSRQGRQLTEKELHILEKDVNLVSEFKQTKLEKEAEKNWDLFYKRNTTKFFKDRHWTKREFSDLISRSEKSDRLVIFEVGCGVGNFMFPLMEEDPCLYFYACDFSKRAVQFVKEHPRYNADRCTPFHGDITTDDLTNHVPVGTVDVATLIFVLSAVHPDKMEKGLRNILRLLKPGGCLLIRDYGQYDHAMLRFAPGHKLADNFYVRQDGTRAFYFSLECLEGLMSSAGFLVESCEYVQRQTVNRKEGINVPRIFVQGKFVKPAVDCVLDNSLENTVCQERIVSQSNADSKCDVNSSCVSCDHTEAGSPFLVENKPELEQEDNTCTGLNKNSTTDSVVMDDSVVMETERKNDLTCVTEKMKQTQVDCKNDSKSAHQTENELSVKANIVS